MKYIGWFCSSQYDEGRIYKELKAKPFSLSINYKLGVYHVFKKIIKE